MPDTTATDSAVRHRRRRQCPRTSTPGWRPACRMPDARTRPARAASTGDGRLDVQGEVWPGAGGSLPPASTGVSGNLRAPWGGSINHAGRRAEGRVARGNPTRRLLRRTFAGVPRRRGRPEPSRAVGDEGPLDGPGRRSSPPRSAGPPRPSGPKRCARWHHDRAGSTARAVLLGSRGAGDAARVLQEPSTRARRGPRGRASRCPVRAHPAEVQVLADEHTGHRRAASQADAW